MGARSCSEVVPLHCGVYVCIATRDGPLYYNYYHLIYYANLPACMHASMHVCVQCRLMHVCAQCWGRISPINLNILFILQRDGYFVCCHSHSHGHSHGHSRSMKSKCRFPLIYTYTQTYTYIYATVACISHLTDTLSRALVIVQGAGLHVCVWICVFFCAFKCTLIIANDLLSIVNFVSLLSCIYVN